MPPRARRSAATAKPTIAPKVQESDGRSNGKGGGDDDKKRTKDERIESAPKQAAAASGSAPSAAAWLMKAEPDTRLEKGIDIAFSVDKFAQMPDRTTPWDGVRNPEARTMMREKMKIGDRVLFYHSNCKVPGIAGLAHVVKEGYPDFTAWDKNHPYYDAKTDKDNPKWFMVDVQLDRKLPHLVPLALLQMLRDDRSRTLSYLTDDHRKAISSMQLLNRGRLSVQHVDEAAYEAIVLLGERGEWLDWPGKWQPKQDKRKLEAKDAAEPAQEAAADKGARPTAAKRSRTKR